MASDDLFAAVDGAESAIHFLAVCNYLWINVYYTLHWLTLLTSPHCHHWAIDWLTDWVVIVAISQQQQSHKHTPTYTRAYVDGSIFIVLLIMLVLVLVVVFALVFIVELLLRRGQRRSPLKTIPLHIANQIVCFSSLKCVELHMCIQIYRLLWSIKWLRTNFFCTFSSIFYGYCVNFLN